MDLFCPCAVSRLVRHAWDTVDLNHHHHSLQWTCSVPGPFVALYDIDMPWIQWTYSIPGPLVFLYYVPGIQWTYSKNVYFFYENLYNFVISVRLCNLLNMVNKYPVLKGIYPEFQVIRGFSQKIPAGLLSYDQIHS